MSLEEDVRNKYERGITITLLLLLLLLLSRMGFALLLTNKLEHTELNSTALSYIFQNVQYHVNLDL